MAVPTSNPDQTAGTGVQSNVRVLGDQPPLAMEQIYRLRSHSTGVMFENARSDQQQRDMLIKAAGMNHSLFPITISVPDPVAIPGIARDGIVNGHWNSLGFPGLPR